MKKRAGTGASSTAAVLVSIIAIVLLSGAYVTFTLNGTATKTSSTTTESSGIQGVVTGYVTVGPSQPVCPANQNCNVNMSGYSLVFAPQCSGSASDCQTKMAQLTQWGHYAILLPAGVYTVTGLYPSCSWVGCASAFPRMITVEGGMQLVFNVDIDTGIR